MGVHPGDFEGEGQGGGGGPCHVRRHGLSDPSVPPLPAELEAMGIRCKVFSPVRPVLSTYQNNRDHRKIVVIDGHTAFTGGVNLADEYINRKERFGTGRTRR